MAAKTKNTEPPVAETTPKAGGSYIRHPETGELKRVKSTGTADTPAAPEAAPPKTE